MNTELSSFAARLHELIHSGFQSRNFGALALELFALQFKHNAAYRAICEARGRTPEKTGHWTQIATVPIAAFKELELTSLAPRERTAVFHSSGTTGQKPSRHFHHAESLAVYEASLWKWFLPHFGDQGVFVLLSPNPNAAPHSSLVHMLETVRRKLGLSESAFTGDVSGDGLWTVDFAATIQKLKTAGDAGKPLAILGTAFSFVHLLDYLAENNLKFNLPENSRVMETGGYKNRSRTMPKSELHALISARLGVAVDKIICEYGMNELSSQAYAVAGGPFQFPSWTRAQIISPETDREVGDDETGLIRVYDLANVFSVAAVQTEDLAVRRGDGFELIGRATMAEPRGCSLMTA